MLQRLMKRNDKLCRVAGERARSRSGKRGLFSQIDRRFWRAKCLGRSEVGIVSRYTTMDILVLICFVVLVLSFVCLVKSERRAFLRNGNIGGSAVRVAGRKGLRLSS